MIKVDLCIFDGVPGCIERFYPGTEWEVVDVLGSCWAAEPPRQWQDQAEARGATVVAYGGDGTWFALRKWEGASC